jgi:hypothetical protein
MHTQNRSSRIRIILAALICVFVPRLVPAQSLWQVEWEKNARGGAKRRNGRCGDTAERGVEKAIRSGFQVQVRDRCEGLYKLVFEQGRTRTLRRAIMQASTRRLDVDTRALVAQGLRPAKDFLTWKNIIACAITWRIKL